MPIVTDTGFSGNRKPVFFDYRTICQFLVNMLMNIYMAGLL